MKITSFRDVFASVFLLIIVMFETFYSTRQCNVAVRCGEIFNNRLLQIVHMVRQYKNFENRLTFGEDIDDDKEGSFFLRHSVVSLQ